MELVSCAIIAEEKRLAELPDAIKELEREKQSHARQALKLHRSTSDVPGSAVEDQQVIDTADQIHLRAKVSRHFWDSCNK